MNQILAIAIGGATGALLRFFVSSGIYVWLGRGFPYGTLTVNLLGSFLIGLMTEALVLERVAISFEYRAAILVGLFGSFTTFSTFSLDTLYLLEQGHWLKAGLNVLVSVTACITAVWIGLLLGRLIFSHGGGVLRWSGWIVPYGIVMVNVIGAFVISLVLTIIADRVVLDLEHRAALLVLIIGGFTTFSSLYLILFLIEEGHAFKTELTTLMSVFTINAAICLSAFWLGSLVGKQL